MKKIKYIMIILIILIFLFLIYYSIKNILKKEVNITDDILITQNNLEQTYLNDLEENNYTVDNPKIILNPYDNSPLTALIMFKTDKSESVSITIAGKDDKTTISNTFDADTNHILPIYGLYADYDNKVIIKIGDRTKTVNIKTDALPNDFVLPTKVYAQKDKINDDLFFVTPSSKGYVAAYDVNGDVRWYLLGSYSWDIQRLKNGHLLLGSNRLINYPYYTVGLVEIDLSGKIYTEYTLPGGYHHDVYEMPNGDFLIATNDFSSGTVEDKVVLLNRKTGEIEKSWNIGDIIPENEAKSENWLEYDWFHNNAVWYDEKTNSITLSGRHLDTVINIDFNTGKLNWILGDSTGWDDNMKKYFFTPVGENFEWQWSQHAAMVLPDGNIFLFDNGNNRSKIESDYVNANNNYSRGVIYKINTTNMTVEQVWEYGKERGNEFYSPYISDVDYYSAGHYLIHSGGIGEKDGQSLNNPGTLVEGSILKSITTEILNNEVVFEMDLPGNYYRAEKLSLYSDNDYKFGKGNRLGSLGVTEKANKKINTLLSINNVPGSYNLKITKEVDRLVINGDFKKGSSVYVILDNMFNQKTYQMEISKRPYTAMCVGIYNETSTDDNILNINYYINSLNLSGKYNIYLKIDDKVYNTNQYVIF